MIISHKYKFIFIHIPKCAGSTIKNIIGNYDDENGQFIGRIDFHPEYGTLNYVHIPLFIIKESFPQIFQKIQEYDSFAIIRDPYKRFPSSLSQHLNRYGSKEMHQMSDIEIIIAARSCIEYLENYKEKLLDVKFIHFQKQIDFVAEEGNILVNRLFLVDDMQSVQAFIQHITEDAEISFKKKVNSSSVYNNKLARVVVQALKFIFGRNEFMSRVYKRNKHYFMSGSGKKRIVDKLLEDERISSFISSYYKSDIELYESLNEDSAIK